jgi:cytochrome c-type biogenesis protein CcmH/NrfG
MSEADQLERIARLLEEVRNDQRTQIERQLESLAIQKAQYEAVVARQGKTAQLQQRAEAIQERSARIVRRIQRVVPVMLVIVFALIAYVSWLLFRFYR